MEELGNPLKQNYLESQPWISEGNNVKNFHLKRVNSNRKQYWCSLPGKKEQKRLQFGQHSLQLRLHSHSASICWQWRWNMLKTLFNRDNQHRMRNIILQRISAFLDHILRSWKQHYSGLWRGVLATSRQKVRKYCCLFQWTSWLLYQSGQYPWAKTWAHRGCEGQRYFGAGFEEVRGYWVDCSDEWLRYRGICSLLRGGAKVCVCPFKNEWEGEFLPERSTKLMKNKFSLDFLNVEFYGLICGYKN